MMRPALLLFLSLSLLGHGALLLSWPAPEISAYQNATAIPAQLKLAVPAPKVQQTSHKQPRPKQRVQAKSAPAPQPIKKQQVHKQRPASNTSSMQTKSRLPQTLVRKTSMQEQQQPLLPEARLRAQIISRIHQNLAQYFFYPRLAQRNGWQGRVLLAFQIASNGDILNIQIRHSSGFSVLDHSAVHALQQVKHLDAMTSLLQGRNFEMELPVIFKLQRG